MKLWMLPVLFALIFSPLVLWPGTVSDVDPVNSVVMVYNEGGHGSGAIIGPAMVLTAKHVATHGGLTIRAADGHEYKVVDVIEDPDSDLAVLLVDGEFDEEPLTLDPTPLKVGDEITVIGTPCDPSLLNCVMTGRVVKVDVDTPLPGDTNLDIYDAHTAPGTSGGPVLDKHGRIRGVNVIGIAGLGGSVPVGDLDVE